MGGWALAYVHAPMIVIPLLAAPDRPPSFLPQLRQPGLRRRPPRLRLPDPVAEVLQLEPQCFEVGHRLLEVAAEVVPKLTSLGCGQGWLAPCGAGPTIGPSTLIVAKLYLVVNRLPKIFWRPGRLEHD